VAASVEPHGDDAGRVEVRLAFDDGSTISGLDVDAAADPVLGQMFGPDPAPGTVMFGSVPRDLTAARAFYVSLAGFQLADGTVTHALEVPLFDMPQSSESLLPAGRYFAVGAVGDAATRLLDTSSGVLFGMPDGTVVDPARPGESRPAVLRDRHAAPGSSDAEVRLTAGPPVRLGARRSAEGDRAA
jgi:hypothetical protein